jgi:hypothetical protein
MLSSSGCALLNGKAFDVLGRWCASWNGRQWIVFAPPDWQMKMLNLFGESRYHPDCERPRFRIKAKCEAVPMTDDLKKLLAEAAAKVAAMTNEEREAMYAQQRNGWANAEMSWPKAKFKWKNGAKVYESYEDYCNG